MFSKTVKTRKSAGADQVETRVSIDFTGVSQAEMETLASATVIINEQAIWRAGEIPEECVISVREQLDRPRGGGFKPLTPESLAKKAAESEETYRQTLKLLGVDDDAIEEMVAKKFG